MPKTEFKSAGSDAPTSAAVVLSHRFKAPALTLEKRAELQELRDSLAAILPTAIEVGTKLAQLESSVEEIEAQIYPPEREALVARARQTKIDFERVEIDVRSHEAGAWFDREFPEYSAQELDPLQYEDAAGYLVKLAERRAKRAEIQQADIDALANAKNAVAKADAAIRDFDFEHSIQFADKLGSLKAKHGATVAMIEGRELEAKNARRTLVEAQASVVEFLKLSLIEPAIEQFLAKAEASLEQAKLFFSGDATRALVKNSSPVIRAIYQWFGHMIYESQPIEYLGAQAQLTLRQADDLLADVLEISVAVERPPERTFRDNLAVALAAQPVAAA